jgi:hypothetical protein
MLKRQVAVTPPPQWVRVVGGFTAHQFTEKRLPTIDELGHDHASAWSSKLPVSDLKSFWGALGCACWAI